MKDKNILKHKSDSPKIIMTGMSGQRVGKACDVKLCVNPFVPEITLFLTEEL